MPFYFILFPSCIVFLCPMYFVIMSNKQFWSWSWSWKTMETLLSSIPMCRPYLDDVIISGRMEQEHLENLHAVFQRLHSQLAEPHSSFESIAESCVQLQATGERQERNEKERLPALLTARPQVHIGAWAEDSISSLKEIAEERTTACPLWCEETTAASDRCQSLWA